MISKHDQHREYRAQWPTPARYLEVDDGVYLFKMSLQIDATTAFGKLICECGNLRSGRWSMIERDARCPKCGARENHVWPKEGYMLVWQGEYL